MPGHLFSFVVEARIISEEQTLRQCGVGRDPTLCMSARLRGGSAALGNGQKREAALSGCGSACGSRGRKVKEP